MVHRELQRLLKEKPTLLRGLVNSLTRVAPSIQYGSVFHQDGECIFRHRSGKSLIVTANSLMLVETTEPYGVRTVGIDEEDPVLKEFQPAISLVVSAAHAVMDDAPQLCDDPNAVFVAVHTLTVEACSGQGERVSVTTYVPLPIEW